MPAIDNITATIEKNDASTTTGYAVVLNGSFDTVNINFQVKLYKSLASKTANKEPLKSDNFKVSIVDLNWAGTDNLNGVLINYLHTIAPYSTGTIV